MYEEYVTFVSKTEKLGDIDQNSVVFMVDRQNTVFVKIKRGITESWDDNKVSGRERVYRSNDNLGIRNGREKDITNF
jgi:hypothetical protein